MHQNRPISLVFNTIWPLSLSCPRRTHMMGSTEKLSYREHPQRFTLETCATYDQGDEETWPDQNGQWQWHWPWLSENTLKVQCWRFSTWDLTLEALITFLTIENNNINNYIVTFEYRVMVTAFTILAMFSITRRSSSDVGHWVSQETIALTCLMWPWWVKIPK